MADLRTPAERLYDLQKSGELYIKPSGADIELDIAKECDRIIAEHRAAASAFNANNGDEPFGTLRDGTPVIGTIDRGDPTGRSGIVHAQWGDWYVSADDDGHISFIADDGSFQSDDDLTMIGLAQLRALLSTDVLDQISAAAYAYGRGDKAPAVVPVTLSLDEQPTPPIIVDILELLEAHFEKRSHT